MLAKASKSKGGKSAGKAGGRGRYRSAVTGRYVTEKYAKSHPKTTVREGK